MNRTSKLGRIVLVSLLGALTINPTVLAKQGATDPIPGTSKGGTNSGGSGGGGGRNSPTPTTPTPAPTPTPLPPIATGPITFSRVSSSVGANAACAGDFTIDPYYPTLLDMVVNIQVDSLQVPDGTTLYIQVAGVGGTLYPWTSNAIVVVGGAGSCSEHVFVTLGASLAGVSITDAQGNVVFSSN